MTRSLASSELCISTYRKTARILFQQYTCTWLDMTENVGRLEWKRKYVSWFQQLQVFISAFGLCMHALKLVTQYWTVYSKSRLIDLVFVALAWLAYSCRVSSALLLEFSAGLGTNILSLSLTVEL